ncbi:DNA gyrase subunit B, partial [Xanthomonas citri pv. citri]|nr:DNA gyrase subunit B [Xanthomonas citri pv. citri]
FVSEGAPALSGVALESLISQYNGVQKLFDRLSRRYPVALLNELIYSPALSAEFAKVQAKVTAWNEQFVAKLMEKETGGSFYRSEVFFNTERQVYEPEIVVTTHGMDTTYRLDFNFISSNEYAKITALGN